MGPTKIYLAVQPAPGSNQQAQTSQTSTTASTPTVPTSKQQVQHSTDSPPPATGTTFLCTYIMKKGYSSYNSTYIYVLEPQTGIESIPELPQASVPSSPEKPKVVVQQVGRANNIVTEESQKVNVVNGQQPSQSVKDDSSTNKFILTPDYIQQSMHCIFDVIKKNLSI